MCQALPFFHALTGCDTASSFCVIGEKKQLGLLFVEHVDQFAPAFLLARCSNFSADLFNIAERFVILYNRDTALSCIINELRFALANMEQYLTNYHPPKTHFTFMCSEPVLFLEVGVRHGFLCKTYPIQLIGFCLC